MRRAQMVVRWISGLFVAAAHHARLWRSPLALATLAFAIAGLPPSSRVNAATQPNILFILTDDQTVEELNANAMPYLFSEPGGHWVKFITTFQNTPLCCPSRATILSGQYAHHTGVINNHTGRQLDDSATLATWLDSVGYRTALMGKYLNGYPFRSVSETYIPPGWDEWQAFAKTRGTAYYDYRLNENGTLVSYGSAESDYSTDVLKNKGLRFLRATSEPFLLYFSPFAAHPPYTPAPKYQNAFSSLQMPRTPNFNEQDVSDKPQWIQTKPLLTLTQQQNQDRDRRNQYRTLLSVDDAIREFFGVLQSRGILENTVVVFTSDNGHLLGEHRAHAKASEYEESVNVPLRIRDATAIAKSESKQR
jgi:N-acetylglucosamine-6-sulfatase